MSFTLCTLNLNGVRAAAQRGFARWLKRRQPDLLCLQELRARPGQVAPEVVSPPGYATRWLCAERKGYAGVAVYARPVVEAWRAGSGCEWSDAEGRVLRADLGELTLVSLYVPSGSSGAARQAKKLEFLGHLLGHTRRLLRSKRPVALCGDFNVAHTELDIHDPRGNARSSGFLPEERAWFTRLLRQGWVDVLRELHPGEPGLYSWWSNRGQARQKDRGWRLDYVLAAPALAPHVQRAWIEKKAGLSDHAPVWIELAGQAPVGERVRLG